jgi:hypothetical protein
MTAVDLLGFHVCLKTLVGMRGARIALSHNVRNASETRKALVEMVQHARRPNDLPTAGTPDQPYSQRNCSFRLIAVSPIRGATLRYHVSTGPLGRDHWVCNPTIRRQRQALSAFANS